MNSPSYGSCRIIPAYAGSTRTAGRHRSRPGDHPRIRGEHDCSIYFTNFPTGSSPHTRGALIIFRSIAAFEGIIPAYAGSTRIAVGRSRRAGDHPRIRGEHIRAKAYDPNRSGSSPHTRGAPKSSRDGRFPGRIIPAYAGSTLSVGGAGDPVEDHPRIRGEHRPRGFRSAPGSGSSPHTRGARAELVDEVRDVEDHPRIRGEHDARVGVPAAEVGSSPHTRGARQLAGDGDEIARIIPAYAGSTPSRP